MIDQSATEKEGIMGGVSRRGRRPSGPSAHIHCNSTHAVRLLLFLVLTLITTGLCSVNYSLAGWTNIGPQGGLVTAFAMDPLHSGTLYAAMNSYSGERIYKSVNAGKSWTGTSSGLPHSEVLCLVINPSNPLLIYAGTHNGAYMSSNGGKSWRRVSSGLPDKNGSNRVVYSLAIDPNNPKILYAGTWYSVYKTVNGAKSWNPANSGLPKNSDGSANTTFLTIDPSNPKTLYASAPSAYGSLYNESVYKTVNGGKSWQQTRSGLPNSEDTFSIAVDPKNSKLVYAIKHNSNGVYASTNSGKNWKLVNKSLKDPVSLAIDYVNTKIVYAATNHGIFISANSGKTWKSVNSGIPSYLRWEDTLEIHSLAIDPKNHKTLYSGVGRGGVFKTTNSGNKWTASRTGMTNSSIDSIIVNPINTDTIYVSTYQLCKSTSAGNAWKIFDNYAGSDSLVIDHNNPEILYSGSSYYISKSTDGGYNWNTLSYHFSSWINHLTIDSANSNLLYATTGGGLYKTGDGGNNWTRIFSCYEAETLDIDQQDNNILYLGTNSSIYRSADRGASWDEIMPYPCTSDSFFVGHWALAIDPMSNETIYVGTAECGIYKSTDSGVNWTEVNSGLTNKEVHSLVIDPSATQTIYAGTSGGVFKSTNGGVNWNKINSGLSNPVIVHLAIDPSSPQTVYAGTSEYGLFKTTNGGE